MYKKCIILFEDKDVHGRYKERFYPVLVYGSECLHRHVRVGFGG